MRRENENISREKTRHAWWPRFFDEMFSLIITYVAYGKRRTCWLTRRGSRIQACSPSGNENRQQFPAGGYPQELSLLRRPVGSFFFSFGYF